MVVQELILSVYLVFLSCAPLFLPHDYTLCWCILHSFWFISGSVTSYCRWTRTITVVALCCWSSPPSGWKDTDSLTPCGTTTGSTVAGDVLYEDLVHVSHCPEDVHESFVLVIDTERGIRLCVGELNAVVEDYTVQSTDPESTPRANV